MSAIETEAPCPCLERCEQCIEECLNTDPVARAACIRACRDCVDACNLVTRLVARDSPLAEEARRLCKLACDTCARECQAVGCSACGTGCRNCVASCG